MTPDEQRVEMMIHLYHDKFLAEAQIPAAQIADVIPSFFMNWLASRFDTLNGVEECQAAGVEMETWQWFGTVAAGQVPTEAFMGVWPAVVMARRPAPQRKLTRVTVALLLNYDDGQIFPFQIHAYPELITDRERISDNDLGHFLHTRAQALVELVKQHGIDGLYSLGAPFGSEHNFNVLMGTLLKILPQLQPEYHDSMKSYVRLLQGILSPPITEQTKAAIASRPAARSGKPVGGFDLSY